MKHRGSFSGGIGFVLAAAASAVGLGNIWRFPYLAAKDGGGLFLIIYIILAFTFGFALLTTELAIGRKTGLGPLGAYSAISKKWGFLGVLATIVPAIIIPYYSVIGGWIMKYIGVSVTGSIKEATEDGYFAGFISSDAEPILWMLIFIGITAFIVFLGVEKGIERASKFLMPMLVIMIIVISIFSLTLSSTGEDGVVRTGLDGLRIYFTPDISGLTVSGFISLVLDAMGQLFYSISVAMGIMVTYASYIKKDVNLPKSVTQIEVFDTVVAILAGMMIIPVIYTFLGTEGLKSAGPGLIFVALPKVFTQMGTAGNVIAVVFFLLVLFAAVTSSVSIMEAIVSGFIDKFKLSRKKATAIVTAWSVGIGIVVCLGYSALYCEIPLPQGPGQILDMLDYLSNSMLMPVVALLTSIFIGWVIGPKFVLDEITNGGEHHFKREKLYIVMVRFVAPALLAILIIKSVLYV